MVGPITLSLTTKIIIGIICAVTAFSAGAFGLFLKKEKNEDFYGKKALKVFPRISFVCLGAVGVLSILANCIECNSIDGEGLYSIIYYPEAFFAVIGIAALTVVLSDKTKPEAAFNNKKTNAVFCVVLMVINLWFIFPIFCNNWTCLTIILASRAITGGISIYYVRKIAEMFCNYEGSVYYDPYEDNKEKGE